MTWAVVNRYDGALKAEHGRGRNMAPFVETEWGSDGHEIMRRLKALADPHNFQVYRSYLYLLERATR